MRAVTPRGFVIYDEFTDDYGHQVRVQKSSNAMRDCVWIFCQSTDDDIPSPHLTVEQAVRVRDALDAFIREHGEQAGRG